MNPTKIDSDNALTGRFMQHQIAWIQGENTIRERGQQAIALAEKSVRIGWTYADAFKNVRKRLWFKNRDYLFATKDYASALEYIRQCYTFAEIFNLTNAVTRHGEEYIQVNRPDEHGRPSSLTEEVKVGVIKFDNGSRITAFSANPQAMAVYGGDVGLDEFAKHPNARLLWETAQGRVTWGFDLAIWSSHDGEGTVFNEFAQEARAACKVRLTDRSFPLLLVRGEGQGEESLPSPNCPWNLYYHVTMEDAIEFGLVETINRAQGTSFTREQFLARCRERARDEEIFQQAYMCNPAGAAINRIVDWAAIERCRFDYRIERVHLEGEQVRQQFGEFSPANESAREQQIHSFLRKNFKKILEARTKYRLGFDVAASGEGDLAVIYIDEAQGSELSLRALFTCRTEDWHFIKTVLFFFLKHLSNLQGAGDETGLGRQICWEAAKQYSGRFLSVNFASKKHDLGFALMNQLSVAQKRFPRSEEDIGADYFALRKSHNGSKWIFSEGRNTYNAASHCDIAWAGALATHAHAERRCEVGAAVVSEHGNVIFDSSTDPNEANLRRLMLSDDPRIWRPLNY